MGNFLRADPIGPMLPEPQMYVAVGVPITQKEATWLAPLGPLESSRLGFGKRLFGCLQICLKRVKAASFPAATLTWWKSRQQRLRQAWFRRR